MRQTPTFNLLGSLPVDPEFQRVIDLVTAHPWGQPQLARPAPLDKCSVIFYNNFSLTPLPIYRGSLGWYSDLDQALLAATMPLVEKMRDEFFPTCRPVKGEISYLGPNIAQGAHIDPRNFHKIAHRAHLCLTTCPGAYLTVKQERQHIQVGEVWTFNNLEPHRSLNEGEGDRVHMIIDYMEETVWQEFLDRYGEAKLYAVDQQAIAENKLIDSAGVA